MANGNETKQHSQSLNGWTKCISHAIRHGFGKDLRDKKVATLDHSVFCGLETAFTDKSSD
ncbi:hypothetical protein ColTof4_14004 [Colletotrichum tofieldiae]|nr:hypothetical protein ColTof3_14637 [Colletotrichum tofieldiae]GKT81581.1 hypothetical protein ColTof4_14004 [Colletotrichum tofieldiae]GKT97558.1 hypothetical protein Ct61P_15408 [Colletotrichum tofieldiae]